LPDHQHFTVQFSFSAPVNLYILHSILTNHRGTHTPNCFLTLPPLSPPSVSSPSSLPHAGPSSSAPPLRRLSARPPCSLSHPAVDGCPGARRLARTEVPKLADGRSWRRLAQRGTSAAHQRSPSLLCVGPSSSARPFSLSDVGGRRPPSYGRRSPRRGAAAAPAASPASDAGAPHNSPCARRPRPSLSQPFLSPLLAAIAVQQPGRGAARGRAAEL
jgi:hypothetical protein